MSDYFVDLTGGLIVDDGSVNYKYICPTVASIKSFDEDGITVLLEKGTTMKILKDHPKSMVLMPRSYSRSFKQIEARESILTGNLLIEKINAMIHHDYVPDDDFLNSIKNYEILDRSEFFIRLTFKDGSTDYVHLENENTIVCRSGKKYELNPNYTVSMFTQPADVETETQFVDVAAIKVGDRYINRTFLYFIAAYAIKNAYIIHTGNGFFFAKPYERTTASPLSTYDIYDIDEAGVPYCGSKYLPITDVVKIEQENATVVAHTKTSAKYSFNVNMSSKNTEKIQTGRDFWAVHSGNLFIFDKASAIYHLNGKYFDYHMNTIYPHSKVNMPDCNINRFNEIYLYNSDTFVFSTNKIILSQIATKIKSIKFNHRLAFYLTIEFDDGVSDASTVTIGYKRYLLLENGELHEFIPSDGIYYSRYGQYRKVSVEKWVGRCTALINGNYVMFRYLVSNTQGAHVYECCGNYIHDIGNATIGEIVLSAPSRPIKGAR